MPIRRLLLIPTFAACVLAAADAPDKKPKPPVGREPFATWTAETFDVIDAHYKAQRPGLYRAKPGGPIDFAWGAGVHLSALAAAARVDPARVAQLNEFIKAMDAYWHADDAGLFGYDASAFNRGFDRYYDDNVWIALALIEAYEVTQNKDYLTRAEETMKFVQSGADDQLDGGIWWREVERKSKHACSTGPAVVALLRLYQIDPKPEYRTQALAWYAWMNTKLQDPKDGLYFDCILADGKLNQTKWTYNTALMIRANVLLAEIERADTAKYRKEAVRVATAAKKRWVDTKSGAIKDGGRFAHMLAEAFIEVSEQTRDPAWRKLAERAVTYAHDHTRNEEGFYGEQWGKPAEPKKDHELIAQSSAARAFARLAVPLGK